MADEAGFIELPDTGPGNAPTGFGRLKYNDTTKRFEASVDAGGYAAVGGGIDGGGTANTIPIFTPDGDTLGNSILTQGTNVIEQFSGLNAQTYNLFNTRTSGTNFEVGQITWQTNVLLITTAAGGGGGTVRDITLRGGPSGAIVRLGANNTNFLAVNTDALVPLAAYTIGRLTNTYSDFFGGNFTMAALNGAFGSIRPFAETVTLNTGAAFTDTTGTIPANSIIFAVAFRITTTITTATQFELGDATTVDRFRAAETTLTAGTTGVGLRHQQGSVATDAAGPVVTAATPIRITLNVNPGAGAMRINAYYVTFTPPTS